MINIPNVFANEFATKFLQEIIEYRVLVVYAMFVLLCWVFFFLPISVICSIFFLTPLFFFNLCMLYLDFKKDPSRSYDVTHSRLGNV